MSFVAQGPLFSLGQVYSQMGDIDASIQSLLRNLAIMRELGDADGTGASLAMLFSQPRVSPSAEPTSISPSPVPDMRYGTSPATPPL